MAQITFVTHFQLISALFVQLVLFNSPSISAYRVSPLLETPFPHHASIGALWDRKWRFLSQISAYPFWDGLTSDFEPIFANISSMTPPYDWDAYASAFFPTAENLTLQAAGAEKGNKTKAAELYLRAATVYRIARQPIPRSEKQSKAWELNKKIYLKGARLLKPAIKEALVPHVYGLKGSEEEGSTVPVYYAKPEAASGKKPVPVLLMFAGLDGYRTDTTPFYKFAIANGWGYASVEIPGTGDSPAIAIDPNSPDRLWSSVLEWLRKQSWVDETKIVVHGVSTGGHYAMRVAHTHKDELLGVVAQGGCSHYVFDEEWLLKCGNGEYAFDLNECLRIKFGYDSLDDMIEDSQPRFSLLENGILDLPSTRLLIVDGVNDTVFPIEDNQLLLEHGSIKEARFFPGGHMGEPGATPELRAWIQKLIG